MTSIFYIEKEKFLRTMMENICKNKGIDVYTIDSAEDCLYLIKDLASDLIIIDLETTKGCLSTFLDSLKDDQISASILATGQQSDWEDIGDLKGKFSHFEPKPLVVDGLLERLIHHLA